MRLGIEAESHKSSKKTEEPSNKAGELGKFKQKTIK
jgi:hypothetical protein